MPRIPSWLRPSPAVRYALVFMFALSLAMSAGSYLAGVGYYHREQAAAARQAAAAAASQRRQGAQLEARLCETLAALAALRPPPIAPGDLSRAYLERQHQVLAELDPDVGCGRRP